MTDAELILWRSLREALPDERIRRQHPIGPFIADFAIPARKLVIEIDGGQHAERAVEDTQRSRILAQHGYRVIRFWNNEVNENTDGVLAIILAEIR